MPWYCWKVNNSAFGNKIVYLIIFCIAIYYLENIAEKCDWISTRISFLKGFQFLAKSRDFLFQV